MDPVTIKKCRGDNALADTLNGGGAAPSYADVTTLLENSGDMRYENATTLLGNSGDMRIPESFAKLRFVVEKAQVLWYYV
jgi:hypothetical protein